MNLLQTIRSILFESRINLSPAVSILGSQAKVEKGVAFTRRNPGDCRMDWFAGNSTAILGLAREPNSEHAGPPTIAIWEMALDPELVARTRSGYLVIACERVFGGLHTQERGAIARVYLNDESRDVIGLKSVRPGHSDYFHRVAVTPEIRSIWPISTCQTVYWWPIHKHHLVSSGHQIVRVEIDGNVAWDIDYVTLVLEVTSRTFRLSGKELLYILIAALLGALIARVLGG
jgi:hypothetical protein